MHYHGHYKNKIDVGQDVEKLETLFIAGEIVNGAASVENSMEVTQSIKEWNCHMIQNDRN